MSGPGSPPDLPELEALKVQAKAQVLAWLDKDFWTMARIMDAVEESGAEGGQVAEVYSLAAASLLADAFGAVGARLSAALAQSGVTPDQAPAVYTLAEELRRNRSQAAALAADRVEHDATRHARKLAGLEPAA